MSLRVEDEQLFFDCSCMERSEFHRVYSSWFNWDREKSNSVYKLIREYIVDNEVFVNKELKKSRKNRDDRSESKRVPKYKLIQI